MTGPGQKYCTTRGYILPEEAHLKECGIHGKTRRSDGREQARGKEDVEAAREVVQRAEVQERSVPGTMGRLSLGEVRHGSLLQ